jgi:hypothetical protein
MDTGGELYSYSHELHAASDDLFAGIFVPPKTHYVRNQELMQQLLMHLPFCHTQMLYTLSRRQPCLFGSSIP